MKQDLVPTRLTFTSPFGTTHTITADLPRGFQPTPQFIEDLTLDGLQHGYIQIDPEQVKKAFTERLLSLPEVDRDSFLKLFSLPVQDKNDPFVSITFTPEDDVLRPPSPSALAVSAVEPITVHLSLGRMKAFNRNYENLKIAPVLEVLDSQLDSLRPGGTRQGTILYPQAKRTRPITSPYFQLAIDKAVKHGIPVDLFLGLITQESGWNPKAKSAKGAMGLGQLMPGTAQGLGVKNAFDPEQNLEGAAKYLRKQFDRFGTWELALAAYNAGPRNVEKTATKGKGFRIPNIPETQNYVRSVIALAQQVQTELTPGQVKAMATEFARQQVRINPFEDPGKTAAIVHARLVKTGSLLPPEEEAPVDDFWSFVKETLTLNKVDFGSHSRRVHTVLNAFPGDSPVIRALAAEGFAFDFAEEDFLKSPTLDTPFGRVNVFSPELVNALLAPTDSKILNALQLALTVARVGVPLKGAAAGFREAVVAGKPTFSALGMGVRGAFAAEIRTLGAIDATYGLAQLAPSLVLKGNVTQDDLVAGVMNMVPFANIMAPGIGEAFRRAGVDGAIDWEGTGLPSWYKGIMKTLVPSFKDIDSAIVLPAIALGSRLQFRRGAPAPRRLGVIQAEGGVARVVEPDLGPVEVEESPIRIDGDEVSAGVHDGDLATVAETRRGPVIEELPPDFDVRNETPDELLPHGVKPGTFQKVKINGEETNVSVAVHAKTGSTAVPFGAMHIDSEPTASSLDHIARQIHTNGEGLLYTSDPSVKVFNRDGQNYIVAAEPRKMSDGTVKHVPVVYKVKDYIRVADAFSNARALERAAKAGGFKDVQSLVNALTEVPPDIGIKNPREGQSSVVGGNRKSALDENGTLVFVDGFSYRGDIRPSGNKVVDEALSIVSRVKEKGLDPNDSKVLRRVAKQMKASKEALDYLLSADAITQTETGALVVRHNPKGQNLNVDVVDAVYEGLPMDAGTSIVLARNGLIEGRAPKMTVAEAESLAQQVMNKEEPEGLGTRDETDDLRVPDEPLDAVEQIAKEMQEVIGEVTHIGRVYDKVTVVASREFQRFTRFLRSVDAELVETALVRITRGLSRDLGNHIREYYDAMKLMRLQATHLVRTAFNMHGGLHAALVKRLLKLDTNEEGALRKVEVAGRAIAGDDTLEFVRPADAKFVARVASHFNRTGGTLARVKEAVSDAFAALFGLVRRNPEVERYVDAVKEATGLEGDAALDMAAELWSRHGDLFATGVTRKGVRKTIAGQKVFTSDIARDVLHLLDVPEKDTATAARKWLTRVSELEVERRAFPGGRRAAVDAVLQDAAPDVAARVHQMMDFIDGESWSPRYGTRMSPFGLLSNVLFLNGAISAFRQLGAFVTAMADMGPMVWARGVAGGLARLVPFLHRKSDPTAVALALAMHEGGGGVGGASAPGVLVADRITRLTNALGAEYDFRTRLERLRARYKEVDARSLPEVGVDSDIDRLRTLRFTEDHIARLINSKHETPRLALTYYVLRATDLGTGTPDALNTPPIASHIVTRTVLPFSRFAIRMGSNVYQRMYKDAALRNWMKARTQGDPHPVSQAYAFAQGWAERAAAVASVDFRYLLTLAAGAGLYEEYLVDNIEDALGMPDGADPTLIEKTDQHFKDALREGRITPEMVKDEFGAIFRAVNEVGALGVFFNLWERQFDEGKPPGSALTDLVSRAPIVRAADTAYVFGSFVVAAAQNADAINSEDFYLRMARDMRGSGLPFLSTETNFLGTTQYDIVDDMMADFSDEGRKWVTDYLREQTMGKVMSRLYGFPLVRNDYLVATLVNSEHHNRLLIETLIRARDFSTGRVSGRTLRFPGPGPDGSIVPPVSAKWEERIASLTMMEAALQARYGFDTVEELYDKLIVPEYQKRAAAQSFLRMTRLPERVVSGDTVIPSTGDEVPPPEDDGTGQ